MWDNRFVFVVSALIGVAIWIFLLKRHEDKNAHRSSRVSNILLGSFALAIVIAIASQISNNRSESFILPGPGTILLFVIGSAVGSFSAKFVWSLYGTRFGTRDPIIGVLVLLLLVIVYSLPVYQNEISSIFSHMGLSSLKTPFVEVTFTQPPQFTRTVGSAANPSSGGNSSALPRPSYPRPGLIGLKQVVDEDSDDYFVKDARYIAFFNGFDDFQPGKIPPEAMDNVFVATKKLLRPVKTLARCLLEYTEIVPDSQLLLIDVKPVIHFFFDMNAKAVSTLRRRAHRPDDPKHDFQALLSAVAAVTRNVQNVVPTLRENCPTKNTEEIAAEPIPDLTKFSYLQPYVPMVLSNLLVAHGSPDEAIDVLAQWLFLWGCARGTEAERTGCDHNPSFSDADELPEWFRIRAEFELKALLFQQAGESNLAYHEFLGDAAKHFAEFVARPQPDHRQEVQVVAATALRGMSVVAANERPGISIRSELERCEEQHKAHSNANASGQQRPNTVVPDVRTIMLRQLLQNENDLLRSELYFLRGNWVNMENLYDRTRVLTGLRPECVNPEQDENYWKATLADYKITSGLVALAIADRLAIRATSTDERNRADEIASEGERNLRDGYRVIDAIRRERRKHLERMPWSIRLFEVSQWEASCELAERAIRRLGINESKL